MMPMGTFGMYGSSNPDEKSVQISKLGDGYAVEWTETKERVLPDLDLIIAELPEKHRRLAKVWFDFMKPSLGGGLISESHHKMFISLKAALEFIDAHLGGGK